MRLGFALEYSLGHTTHAQNLKRVLQDRPDILSTYIDLPYDGMTGAWTRLPGVRSNWSLRASLGAWLGLRGQAKYLDGALFHTQVTSLFSAGLMRRLPSVISLDATPLQYDALGAFYGHAPSGSARIEAFKKRLNQRAFGAARHLVTWSEWAKDSLADDYGVPRDKVTVIPPGIDTARWNFDRSARPPGPVTLLFVGGDFERKGGDTLLDAFARLPSSLGVQLNIVTKTSFSGNNLPGVTVWHDVKPNSEPLLRLFAQADLFVFPTRGDCLPLAVMEALAAGLPVVTTTVGALPEAVTHGETGWIVPPDDPAALADALIGLASDASLRARLSVQARAAGRERFDAKKNYYRLLETIRLVGMIPAYESVWDM
ncbi:MAG: glycosyltransferase family 4 protein [Armatimonadota bacterium]|nr:glycosyltransferase family 4 protein [Armatimonadota bacterium]